MKKAIFIPILIALVSCVDKKSESVNDSKQQEINTNKTIKAKKEESLSRELNKAIVLGNYTGKIGSNLEVAFHLPNSNGVIDGFYYYNKIGVDIKVVGTVVTDSLVAYELNYKNDTLAILKGKISDAAIKGKWISTQRKKELPFTLEKTDTAITPLPENIEGEYYNDICDVTLTFAKTKGEYYYTYKSNERTLTGKLSFSRGDDLYINLTEIEYAEDYFDVALFEEDPKKEKEYAKLKEIGKRRVGVECYYSPDELTIQNYGNAMNYYVKLNDCSEKYIHFKKQ